MDRTVHTQVVAAAAVDGRGAGRASGGRSRRGRQPYAWLGVGAVGLGLGVGAVLSAGVAHADGVRGDSSASGSGSSRSGSRSADADSGPVAPRRGGVAGRGSVGPAGVAAGLAGSVSVVRADGVVRGGVVRAAAAAPDRKAAGTGHARRGPAGRAGD